MGNEVTSYVNKFMYQVAYSLNINFVLSILVLLVAYFVVKFYIRAKYVDLLLNREIEHKKKKTGEVKDTDIDVDAKRKSSKMGFIGESGFGSFKNKLTILLTLKNKSSYIDIIYKGFLGALLLIVLLFARAKMLPLGIMIATISYFMILRIITELIYDFDYVIRRNFTHLVNSMVKHFSKYNNLSVILYECSKEMKEEELSSLLVNLSRELIVDSDESSLINCIEKSNNLWLDSFLLTLINYKEKGSKENTISNLLRLSEFVDKKNALLAKMVSDRKPVVIVNYMLLIVGIAIFIGNLALNPIMKEFLSSTTGQFSLIVGIVCMYLTVITNMKLTKE